MASLRSHFFRLYLKKITDWSGSVPELRLRLERQAGRATVAKGVQVSYVTIGDVSGEWLRPAGAPDDRVILYLHGGGYFTGSCKTHRPLVSHIAKAGRTNALLLDYRLAPEHPFPAAVEDSTFTYRWLLSEGFRARNIVIAGDSAGGGLVIATLLCLRDQSDPLPVSAVCMSPWTDLEGTGESLATCATIDPSLTIETIRAGALYAGDNDPRQPLISPIYADLAGLPPLLIHVGTDEILLSDSTRLADKAKTAGLDVTLKVWDRMWHVFHFFAPFMPEANRAIDEIGAFIAKTTESLNIKIRRAIAEPVEIEPYNPSWPRLFEEEKEHLLSCLPPELVRRIEHFGSTAVPGLAAKPIVDILIEVTDLAEVRRRIPPILEAQGYDYFWRPTWGDDKPPFYAWFIKRDAAGNRTHHIHMVEGHFEHWDRLLFRDYLREHSRVAKQYEILKLKLSKAHDCDRVAYTNAKADFIMRVTKIAKEYYAKVAGKVVK